MSSHADRSMGGLGARVAFTLIELLVVMVIIVLLLATAVPATRSLIREGNKSLAQNQLQAGLRAARDAAVRGGPGQDAVAVFQYDTGSQQLRITTCVLAASFEDEFNFSEAMGFPVERDIFTPDPFTQPVTIPSGWSIRGFAPPGLLAPRDGVQNPWYAGADDIYRNATEGAHWLFPEEAFFDLAGENGAVTGTQGSKRQTFVIRFEGGTGRVRAGDTRDLLVFDPANTYSFRDSGLYRFNRSLDAFDARAYVQDLLLGPIGPGRTRISDPELRTEFLQELFLGENATDTVLARPVTALALYEEAQLAGALRIRLDQGTGLIYRDVSQFENPNEQIPDIPEAGVPNANNRDATIELINNWITFGQAVRNGNALNNDEVRAVRELPAILYRVEPDSGSLGEVSP